MAALARLRSYDWTSLIVRHGFLLFAILVIVVPTLHSLAVGPWTTEAGVQGPIVLVTGGWLLWRRLPEIRANAQAGALWLTISMLVVGVPLYVFGRAFDFISIEVAAMLLILFATAYSYVGLEVLKLLWFPILYLGFMVPLPGWILDVVTQPLKQFVSEVVTNGLQLFGYPIVRVGVTLYIAQYQLLVEDACAGLNSLVSLISIGLFYVYILHNSSWKYSLLLLFLVIPLAILANVVRVTALVLITYYFGDAAAQGFLHNFAGMVTFTSALLLIFLVDTLLRPVRRWLGGEDGHAA
ncbi:MAG: exosortase V [Polymorphobacter sp.]